MTPTISVAELSCRYRDQAALDNVSLTTRELPFGMMLGVSRRAYYLGTALLVGVLGVVYGLALTVGRRSSVPPAAGVCRCTFSGCRGS